MSLTLALAILGTLAGIGYFGLGLVALAQLKERALGAGNKFVDATLLWSLQPGRYAPMGARLCMLGNVSLVTAAASWLGCAILR
jgi:hypothetical protein